MNTDNTQLNLSDTNPAQRRHYIPLFLLIIASCNTAFAADIFNGKVIYQNYCESCHGSDGAGVLPGTPNFRSGKGLMQPDRSLFDVIRNGKNSMPGFQGVMDKEEIFDVIGYLRTFF